MYEKLYFGSDGSFKEFARDLRKGMTDAEAILWECLRGRRLGGYKFRRQHAIESYIVDFYCPQKGLVIEVNGGIHREREQQRYDRDRTSRLEELGLIILQVSNEDVTDRLVETLKKISNALK